MRKYLKQTSTGEVFVWTPELASRSDMVPFIGSPSNAQDVTSAVLPPINSDVVRFHLSAKGIGDAVTGLYVACGLASAGHKVEYNTLHRAWLTVEHPNLTIVSGAEGVDANANYREQLKQCRLSGMSRPGWYLQNLTRAHGLNPCVPVRPDVIHKPPALLSRSYGLLAPFSNAPWRAWGLMHYRRLAILLQKDGANVVVMADRKNQDLAVDAFYGLGVPVLGDLTAKDCIGLIAHADFLVCNDSGPAHLGGLYGKRTIAVVSQFHGSYLFDGSAGLTTVQAQGWCAPCYEQDAAGWDQVCNLSCSQLQTVRPESVFEQVKGV